MDINILLEKLDNLFAENKIDDAENYLSASLEKAINEGDTSAIITILNELIGLYRDISQYEKAKAYCGSLVKLMETCNLENTVHSGTTYLNIANVYRASGDYDYSFDFYEKVRKIFDEVLDENDFLNAGYYNNLSLLYQETGDFTKSCECLEKALAIIKTHEDLSAELASTYANLSLSYLHCGKIELAEQNALKSLEIFERDEEKDFHYSSSLSAMADIMMVKKDYQKAISFYEKALKEHHQKTGYNLIYSRLLNNLENAYKIIGQPDVLKGINLAHDYYNTFGKNMISEKFHDYENKIAVGIVGEGSDCFGFDDKVSRDHDFGCGFCMWLTDEVYNKIGAELQLEYDKLPSYFRGVPKLKIRRGVYKISDFVKNLIGIETYPKNYSQWQIVSEHGISALLNGKIFRDDTREFTSLRKEFLKYYPNKIQNEKLAYYLINASQNGQYNYARAMARSDVFTTQLHLNQFAENIIKIIFVLNRQYIPHIKIYAKSLEKLPLLSDISEDLKKLFSRLPSLEYWKKHEPEEWYGTLNRDDFHVELIEKICSKIAKSLKENGFCKSENNYLEVCGKEIIAMQNKMEMIDEIINIEWKMFDKVQNKEGRASCQDDWETFNIMRKSQYMTWNEKLLESYINDLQDAQSLSRNLITEKYARMMKYTVADEYAEIEQFLPEMAEEQCRMIELIANIQVGWIEDFALKYPKLSENTRSIHSYDDSKYNTSYETYLKGELSVYSPDTLALYGRFIIDIYRNNGNLAEMTMQNTVVMYGYKNLTDAENRL